MRTGRSDRSIGIATRRTARIMASSPSITNLGRAPHRLMFFVGGLNLLLAMAWWAAWLISARWGLGSEERRVGKACVSPCRPRRWTDHKNKKNTGDER